MNETMNHSGQREIARPGPSLREILALDFGTKTGWAALTGDHVESGVQAFDLARGESPGMKFIRFRRWLEEMLTLTRPVLCVYEAAHHRGGYATELLVGMATRLQEICAERGIEYAAVHSATLKESENHAREIKFLAARRIGELVPPEKSGPGRGKKSVRNSDGFPDRQRLSEFRKLAAIPEPKFRERMARLKAREEGKVER